LSRDPSEELLYAAFLFTRRDFPAYSFPASDSALASIIFNSKTKPDLTQILARTKAILRGNETIPILYNPYKSDYSNLKQAEKKIALFRSKPAYFDLFHSKRAPLLKLLELWSNGYEFSRHEPSSLAIKSYFNMFCKSSRFIHIALHYFVTASRLIRNDFIEDGGINLQLAVDAVIRDFMEFKTIRDKRTAAQLFQDTVLLPYGHMEFLDDLYESRNRFLAHIDEDMYTENENINDPDRYCYEHYESVAWLISRYIRYKKRLESQTLTKIN
jgi:hypothetical protein